MKTPIDDEINNYKLTGIEQHEKQCNFLIHSLKIKQFLSLIGFILIILY